MAELPDVRFLTVAEVAEIMRVSKMTVYRLVHSGSSPPCGSGAAIACPRRPSPRPATSYRRRRLDCSEGIFRCPFPDAAIRVQTPDIVRFSVGSVIKKRRKRMAKKKHRKLLRKTRHQRRNKK
jgi:hypothetical protein